MIDREPLRSSSKIDKLRHKFQCIGDELPIDELLQYTKIVNRRALRCMIWHAKCGIFNEETKMHLIIRKGCVKRIK